jgi:hypothetical protein
MKPHVSEDWLQPGIVRQIEFDFLSLLVAPRLRWSFVREHLMTARQSNTDDHAVLAQTALGIVEEDIGFQGTWFFDVEPEFGESAPDFCKLSC